MCASQKLVLIQIISFLQTALLIAYGTHDECHVENLVTGLAMYLTLEASASATLNSCTAEEHVSIKSISHFTLHSLQIIWIYGRVNSSRPTAPLYSQNCSIVQRNAKASHWLVPKPQLRLL